MHRSSPQFLLRSAALSACATAMIFLSGCAGISGTTLASSLDVPLSQGRLHGGQQAIQGAQVYLYGANTTGGYGSASTSLLTPGATGTTTDTNGNAYVTSDANGFSPTAERTPAPQALRCTCLRLAAIPGLRTVRRTEPSRSPRRWETAPT